MVYAVVVAVVILGVIHVINGTFSICLGVTSSIKAEIWLAHTVSPIWSGAFVSMRFLFAQMFVLSQCMQHVWVEVLWYTPVLFEQLAGLFDIYPEFKRSCITKQNTEHLHFS